MCVYIWVFFPSCAAQFTDGSQYSVLLMITDGVISDMVQTKEAVVNVSKHAHTHREVESHSVILSKLTNKDCDMNRPH